MRQKFIPTLAACCGVALLLLTADVALGCPMCKQAAESDPRLPKAFMVSIVFMMSVPFALVTGFGVAFWRLSKRGQEESEE